MGYSKKVVLMNSITVSVNGLGVFGGVATQSASLKIPLDPGQKIISGRIFVQITTPPHLIDAKTSVYWNDNFVGDIQNLQHGFSGGNNIDYLNGTGSEDISNILDPTGQKNNLVIKCDNGGAPLDFTIYADYYYEINTPTPPSQDPTVTNPPGSSGPPSSGNPFVWPTWDQVKPYAIVAGVVIGAAIIGPPIIGAVVSPGRPKCRGPLCSLIA